MNITLVKDAKETQHKLPNTWNDISLKQYVRIMKVLKRDEKTSELEKTVSILRILTDIPEADILRLPVSNITILGSKMNELISSYPNDELNHLITINNIEYGFHPKISDITFGEWVDIDSYIDDDVDDNLHKIMSVLYRPVIGKSGDKYQIEPYEPCKEREQIMLDNLTVGDFYGVSVFFSDLGRELLSHSLKSSIQNLREGVKEDTEKLKAKIKALG